MSGTTQKALMVDQAKLAEQFKTKWIEVANLPAEDAILQYQIYFENNFELLADSLKEPVIEYILLTKNTYNYNYDNPLPVNKNAVKFLHEWASAEPKNRELLRKVESNYRQTIPTRNNSSYNYANYAFAGNTHALIAAGESFNMYVRGKNVQDLELLIKMHQRACFYAVCGIFNRLPAEKQHLVHMDAKYSLDFVNKLSVAIHALSNNTTPGTITLPAAGPKFANAEDFKQNNYAINNYTIGGVRYNLLPAAEVHMYRELPAEVNLLQSAINEHPDAVWGLLTGKEVAQPQKDLPKALLDTRKIILEYITRHSSANITDDSDIIKKLKLMTELWFKYYDGTCQRRDVISAQTKGIQEKLLQEGGALSKANSAYNFVAAFLSISDREFADRPKRNYLEAGIKLMPASKSKNKEDLEFNRVLLESQKPANFGRQTSTLSAATEKYVDTLRQTELARLREEKLKAEKEFKEADAERTRKMEELNTLKQERAKLLQAAKK